jgi:predicted nucleic acid-binding protein
MKSKTKVVLDTNVVIDGLFQISESCSKILDYVDSGEIQLYFSQDTIGELIYIVKNFAANHINEERDRLE